MNRSSSPLVFYFINNKNPSISKKKNIFSPSKYYTGLTKKEAEHRQKEIAKGKKTKSNDRRAYKPFETDKNKKTKPSSYTTKFHSMFPEVKNLQQIEKMTGIPLDILQKVYDKGLAAWRTGHRPGATQGQWAYARVYSFVVKGCTHFYPDHKLVEEAKSRSAKAKAFWQNIKCYCNKGCA
jgi:hypothetical protein